MSIDNKTKTTIANSFKELIKSRKFDKITIQQIVDHCDLNRQTFYYHFKDKYDLVNWIYDTEVNVCLIRPRNKDDAYYNITVVLKKIDQNKTFYRKILISDNNQHFKNHLENLIREYARNLVDFNSKRSHADPVMIEFSISFLACAYAGTIFKWIEEDSGLSPESLSRFLFNLTDKSFFNLILKQ